MVTDSQYTGSLTKSVGVDMTLLTDKSIIILLRKRSSNVELGFRGSNSVAVYKLFHP